MKKIFALLVTLCLTLSLCAFAEAPEFEMPEINWNQPEVQINANAKMAAESADVVTVDGRTVTVATPEVTYTYTSDPTLPYILFTQDLRASFDSYLYLNDPVALQQAYVEQGVHLNFTDLSTMNEIYVLHCASPIPVFDASIADLCARAIIENEGLSNIEEINYDNGMTWYVGDGIFYVTFVGDQMVYAICYAASDVPSEDDLLDFEDMMGCLVVA